MGLTCSIWFFTSLNKPIFFTILVICVVIAITSSLTTIRVHERPNIRAPTRWLAVPSCCTRHHRFHGTSIFHYLCNTCMCVDWNYVVLNNNIHERPRCNVRAQTRWLAVPPCCTRHHRIHRTSTSSEECCVFVMISETFVSTTWLTNAVLVTSSQNEVVWWAAMYCEVWIALFQVLSHFLHLPVPLVFQ